MREWRKQSALVVGFGSIGRRHTRILREIGLEDVRVCEVFADLRDTAAKEFGITRVYDSLEPGLADRPDTVFVCSPTGLHVEQITAAMRAGADVLTEKPLSVSVDGLDELDSLAKQLGKIVMVAHCFRFHEGLRRAKQWLDEGRIGRLVSVRCLVGEYIPEVMPNYKNMYISQYSGVYELMHDIDLALWYADRPVIRAYGVDGTYSDAGMKSPDLAEMIVEFEDRRVASVHLDFFERARHRQTELLGTEGTIYVEFARWDQCRLSIYEAKTGEWTHDEIKTDRDDMFREEDRTFLEATASRKPVPIDIAEGRKVIEVMAAAQESARTGAAVVDREG
jgi:predicted dehydrogenase